MTGLSVAGKDWLAIWAAFATVIGVRVGIGGEGAEGSGVGVTVGESVGMGVMVGLGGVLAAQAARRRIDRGRRSKSWQRCLFRIYCKPI